MSSWEEYSSIENEKNLSKSCSISEEAPILVRQSVICSYPLIPSFLLCLHFLNFGLINGHSQELMTLKFLPELNCLFYKGLQATWIVWIFLAAWQLSIHQHQLTHWFSEINGLFVTSSLFDDQHDHSVHSATNNIMTLHCKDPSSKLAYMASE